jgi:glc operon protein GlcG
MAIPYGMPISVEAARTAAAAAAAEARRNTWTMAIAVVDPGGELVFFEKMDGTQTGSVQVAIAKARTSALFKRPTRAFQDALAAGGEGLKMLALSSVTPVEGGLLLIAEGKIVGAIGASGGTSPQDAQCAQAGVDTLK